MIRSLLHVGLIVPDLEVGKSFYELFGLHARISGNDVIMRCEGRDLDQIRLMQGPKKKLQQGRCASPTCLLRLGRVTLPPKRWASTSSSAA